MLQRLLDRLYGKRDRSRGKADEAAAPSDKADTDPPPASPVAQDDDAVRGPDSASAQETPSPVEKPAKETDEEPETDGLREQIVDAIKTVFDPEIPVNIYDLGLIYGIEIEPSNMVHITMTLTAPNCPAAGILPGQVQSAARGVSGVKDVALDLVFDPPWGPDRMSEAAKLELGMM